MYRFNRQWGIPIAAAAAVYLACVPVCFSKPPGRGNEPAYTILTFEPFGSGSPWTWVSDVTELGTAAVGGAELADGNEQSAYLDLTTGVYSPFAVGFRVSALNNHHQLVGSVETSAAYWNDMTFAPVLLPPLAGDTTSAALRINDAGVILGESGNRGVVWRVVDQGQGSLVVDGPHALPPLRAGGTTRGRNLNELADQSAQVVGRSCISGSPCEAVVWTVEIDDNNQLVEPSLPESPGTLGGTWTVGYGINQAGDIVGKSNGLPFLAAAGQPMVALPMPRKANGGYATDLNDAGAIVGRLNTPIPFSSYNYDAYLWQDDGQPVLLESLIGRRSGWEQLIYASEITNGGIISGSGYFEDRQPREVQRRGFLMTPTAGAPVPEPSSLLLVGLACAGLALRRRSYTGVSTMNQQSTFRTLLALRFLLVPLFVSCCLCTGLLHAQVTFDWATVGNPGNPPDRLYTDNNPYNLRFGAVDYIYRISKHEVTNDQYVEFLNAVDATGTNPNSVYNSSMNAGGRGGIRFNAGGAAGSKYSTKTNMGNKPVNYVSFLDAMRFVNWLENGQLTDGSGTESGVYTIGCAPAGACETRAAAATVFIPSDDEWYKAAYHQPAAQGGDADDYWLYPTATFNFIPTRATANAVGDISNPGYGNVANYDYSADWNGEDGNVTTVGSAGPLSASFYGTFDQGGNVREWTETRPHFNNFRSTRGGDYRNGDYAMAASNLNNRNPSNEPAFLGFRVASIPEPSTSSLFAVGSLLMLSVRRRCEA